MKRKKSCKGTSYRSIVAESLALCCEIKIVPRCNLSNLDYTLVISPSIKSSDIYIYQHSNNGLITLLILLTVNSQPILFSWDIKYDVHERSSTTMKTQVCTELQQSNWERNLNLSCTEIYRKKISTTLYTKFCTENESSPYHVRDGCS